MTPRSVAGDPGDADTVPATAEGAAEPARDAVAARRRRRRWYWGVGLTLVVGAVLGFVFVPTPYVLLEPGSVRSAQERISVDGAPTYEADSDLLFTTVFVDRASLWDLVRGALDDAIEVHTQEEIYGDRGRDETQRINRHEMDVSKLVATMESLQLLGHDASLTAEGAEVVEVESGSAADGLLLGGDVIVAVDGSPVALPADLRAIMAGKAPGDEVTVSVRRSGTPAGEVASEPVGTDDPGEVIDLEVTLGESSDDQQRAVLGVRVEPANPSVDADVEVEIDSGVVSGPSAGLAWSLAIIDLLTPGDLAGGRDVAVTGEILEDGSVGEIGGLVQKVATVERAGVEVFLYPAATPVEDQQEMRRVAGDDLELVPVSTLAEAVRHLDPGLELPGS